jgi:hypothetical protein
VAVAIYYDKKSDIIFLVRMQYSMQYRVILLLAAILFRLCAENNWFLTYFLIRESIGAGIY